MTILEVIARASDAGYRIDLGPVLKPIAVGAKLPPELLAELKARRAEIGEYLAELNRCQTCGDDVARGASASDLATTCTRWACPHKRRERP